VFTSYVYAGIAAFGETEAGTAILFTITFEFMFTIELVMKFSTSYLPDDSHTPITDHSKIARRYLKKGSFK